jgi:hypothetical protein
MSAVLWPAFIGYFTALALEQIHKRDDRNSENELCDSMNDLCLATPAALVL